MDDVVLIDVIAIESFKKFIKGFVACQLPFERRYESNGSVTYFRSQVVDSRLACFLPSAITETRLEENVCINENSIKCTNSFTLAGFETYTVVWYSFDKTKKEVTIKAVVKVIKIPSTTLVPILRSLIVQNYNHRRDMERKSLASVTEP